MIKNFLILLLSVTFFVGCSSDSEDEVSGGTTAVSYKTGVFVITDPIANLHYETATYTDEYTNDKGEFKYMEGEDVSFSVAGVDLGSAEGRAVLTPFNLVPGSEDAADSAATNTISLLLSLTAGSYGDVLTIDNAVSAYDFASDFDITDSTDILSLLFELTANTGTTYTAVEPETSWLDDITNWLSDSNTTEG